MADKEKKFFNEDADFDKMPDFNNDVDDYNGFDSNGEEDNSRDPVPVKMMKDVGRTLSYAGSKASEGAATGIREKLESAFPEATASYDTVTQAVGEAQMGWDQFQNEARPVWNKLKITTKQFARNMKGLLPLGLDQKLVNFLDEHFPNEEKFKEPSLKEQREANLSNILGEVFKLQTEKSMENQQNEMVNRAIDDRLTQKRHAESVAIEGSIKNAVLFQADFTKSIFTSYLKKDLELKYRHFYVAQDTLSTLVNTTKMLQERLTAIVKNTGLPDSQKVQISETAKKMMKEKFLSTLGSKTSNLFTTIRENMSKQIIKPAIGILQTINDAVAGINDMAEQQETMTEMGGGGEPAMFSYANVAGIGIGALGKIIGRKAAQGILKVLPRTVRDKIELYSNKPLRRLRDWMFEQRKKNNDPDNPSLLGMIADKLLGRFDNNYKLENYTFQNLNKPGSITNKTIMTIEQIIPGFLSMQTKFLEMIATKNEHVEQKVYDFKTKKFVGEKEQTTNNLKNLFGNSKQRGSALGAYATTTNQTISKVYSTDNKKRLDLIGLQAANAKDIELFKFGLALSDKHYSYSRSDLDIIRDVAKSGDAGKVSDDIKKSDFWKYGFSICEHPIGVAKFLEAYLLDDNGHVNDLALKTFRDQVEQINEDKVPRIKEYIFNAEERGDHTIGDNVGKRDANGDLIIDPAKLLKFFANGASDSEFNKSFELNTARAANDKNWSTDDHTLMENLFHQVKTLFQNGAIGQTISSWAEKGENIFKNVHKGILHLFGWKDKDIDKNFESIDKTLHKGIEWAQGQVENFKESWAKTKKFFGDGINHATLALAAKFFSGKDNAYRKLYKVFFYTKDAGKDLEGQPRNINAVDFINVVLNDKGLRDIFKSFAKDVQKGNFGAQAVVDILSETFPWFGETFSLFVEHDGKEAAFREIFDIDDDEKRNKAVIEAIQKLKHYKETRATRWSSGISASNRAEDEYNKSQKAKEVEKKNSITTDTKPKNATVATIDLLTKNEQHLFKIEGALADIHAIYISEHKGYEGLKTARESLSKELGLLKNADYDDTKERRELYQRYQHLRAEAADIKDDAARASRLDDLDTDYKTKIAALDAKKSKHYANLRGAIENGEAAKSSFSKNASYMDSLIRENTSVAEKAHIAMSERDAEAEYRERDAQQLMNKSKITERLTGNKAKRVAKAKEQVIDEQYKDQIIKNLTADPTIINSLIIEGKLKEKPQGTTNEEKANNVYNTFKEKGELAELLDRSSPFYDRTDLYNKTNERAELNKYTKLNELRTKSFKKGEHALNDGSLNQDHQEKLGKRYNDNGKRVENGVSIYERIINEKLGLNKNANRLADFRMLYEQIQTKVKHTVTAVTKLLNKQPPISKGLEARLKGRIATAELIKKEVEEKFITKEKPNLQSYDENDVTDETISYLKRKLSEIPNLNEDEIKSLGIKEVNDASFEIKTINNKKNRLKNDFNKQIDRINSSIKMTDAQKAKGRATIQTKYDKQLEHLNAKLSEQQSIINNYRTSINGTSLNQNDQDQHNTYAVNARNQINQSLENRAYRDIFDEGFKAKQYSDTDIDNMKFAKDEKELEARRQAQLASNNKVPTGVDTIVYAYLEATKDFLSKANTLKVKLEVKQKEYESFGPDTKVGYLPLLVIKRKLIILNNAIEYVNKQNERAYNQDESITSRSLDYIKTLTKNLDKLEDDSFISEENRHKLNEIKTASKKNKEQKESIVNGTATRDADIKVIEQEIEKVKSEHENVIKTLLDPFTKAKEQYKSEKQKIHDDTNKTNHSLAEINKEIEAEKDKFYSVKIVTETDHNTLAKRKTDAISAIEDQIKQENDNYEQQKNAIINDSSLTDSEKFNQIKQLNEKHSSRIKRLTKQKERTSSVNIPEVTNLKQRIDSRRSIISKIKELKRQKEDLEKTLNDYSSTLTKLKEAAKETPEIKQRRADEYKKFENRITELKAKIADIKQSNDPKYTQHTLTKEEENTITSNGKQNSSSYKTFLNSINSTYSIRDRSDESGIADFEKRQAEERQKRLEEEARNAKKYATGGNFIKDGTSLEKYGGVTDGWTSVLNGTGIAGEAGAETILPHKANERFKKLVFNAINETFGKTAAKRAVRALRPNKDTMKDLDIDTKMFAKGGTNNRRRRNPNLNTQGNRKAHGDTKYGNKKPKDDTQQQPNDTEQETKSDNTADNTDNTQTKKKGIFGRALDTLKQWWKESDAEIEAEEKKKDKTTTETKKDKEGELQVTPKSPFKDILYAQLQVLRDIREKSFIGFGFGNWHIGETLKDIKNWFGKKYQGIKDWWNSSSFIGKHLKGIALSPFRMVDSLIRNRVFSVYEMPAGKDEQVGTPLVTPDDFEKGLYTDPDLKNRLKSVDDIKGPIWNSEKKMVITEKNIEAGLCDEKKKPINSFARQVGRFIRRRLGNIRDIVKGVATSGLSFVKNLIFNDTFDIYKNPQNDKTELGTPLVTVADFEAGLYLDRERTKRIKSVADITGPVWDKDGNLKIKEEDLPLLCDINRKPINSLSARLGRFARRRLGGVLKIAKTPISFVKNLLFNEQFDVYVSTGDEKNPIKGPLIRVDDFDAGLYLDKEKTRRITSVTDITGPVWDHIGNCRITEEDFNKGLVDKDGKPINKGFATRLARKLRHGILGLKPIKTLKKVVMAPINFLSWVNKRNVDVYSKRDPKKLLVSAKDIDDGLLQYEDGKIVEAASDIDQPVWWTKNEKNKEKAGQIAIAKEDIEAGLIENDGTSIKGRLGIAGDLSKHVISSALQLGGKIITAPIKVGKFLVDKLIIGKNDPYIDVYVVDRRYKTGLRLALEGTKIESGAYFTIDEDDTTHTPVTAAYDINSPVYELVNDKPKVLITEKNLKDGLYDANGKRIHKGRLNGLLIRAGSALIHGAGKLVGGTWHGIKSLASKGWDLGKDLLGGLFNKGKGIFNSIGGFFKNLFNPASMFIGRKDIQELVTDKLLDIYHLLYTRIPIPKTPIIGDADNDGDRDGSWDDYKERHAKLMEERQKKKDQKEKEEEKRKKKEENKKAKEEARRKKKEDKEKDDSEGGGFFSNVASYFLGDKLSKIFSRKGKAEAAETAAEAVAGGKKGMFKKLFDRLPKFFGRGKAAEAAGNAVNQTAHNARAGFSAGSRAAESGTARAGTEAAAQSAERSLVSGAASNGAKRTFLHRVGNLATKVVGKHATKAVLSTAARLGIMAVGANALPPIIGQVASAVLGIAAGAAFAYEIMKTDPMDLRWQRVRFPAYGLDTKGTVYEFKYEDSIKDIEKETFKAMIAGKPCADESAIEHFGQSIGFLDGYGLMITDKAINNRAKKLEYLKQWYVHRFCAPFMLYCQAVTGYRPNDIPETEFPDATAIPYDLQDTAIEFFKEELEKIKSDKRVYDEQFDLTDEKKYKDWLEKDEKAKKEAKEKMSVGERAYTEAMETDDINDDWFDYTNTKNQFSQMWYNIKHGNLIDATGNGIMGVVDLVAESISGIWTMATNGLYHLFGGSTHYEQAWHKAKVVLYGLDEKVDIDDLDDFEKVVGPIVNKKRGELKKEDLFDKIDDLLDDADYDTDDFIDAAKDILGYDDDKARSTVLNYIYSWYIKRFKLVLNSFLILGRAFEGETVDEFEVDDIPDQYKMQVLESFPKKTEEQIKKADCEKYKLTLEDFAKFIRTENKDKLLDASKKLNNKQTFMDMVANGKNDNEGWSLKAIVATGSHLFFKLFSAVDGLDVLSDYEFDWRKRYKYYNFSKDLYDPMKASRLGTDFDKALSELEDLATDILDKKKELGSNATRLRLTKLAEDMGFTAWQPGDNRRGPDAMDSILKASTDIVKPAPSKFYEKMMYAKSKYLMTWFKMTFLPVFSILLQVVRKYTETKNGSINVDAIPELKREEALEAFTKSADAEVGKSSKVRVILGEREFTQYYNELTLIDQGIHSNKFRTNAENILKEQEKEKDTEETNIISQSVSDKNVATSLSKVDQNIANKTKVKLKGANLAVLKESMSHIEFIDPKLSQKENWRRLAYWAYGIAKDKVATQDIPVTSHQPLGYFYRKLEKLTFNRWYHNKDFNEKDIDSTLSSLYFVTDLYEEKDGNWSRSEKLKYLKEWYEKRFVPMFWTLTKAIEQQHAGGSGEIIDLKNLNIAYGNWEIFENMTELPEPEFQALVLATVDELKKQLGNIEYLTPSLMGYRKWNITQIKKEKGSIGNNVSDTSETKTTEQGPSRLEKALAESNSHSEERRSAFTSDSVNRQILGKESSSDKTNLKDANYSYMHEDEFANSDGSVKKFANGGVINRYANGGVVSSPTKLAENILAGEAGKETILPHKPGARFDELAIDAINSVYGHNTAGLVASALNSDRLREALKKVDVTDEELDEPLSSSTDLLLYNIYKRISTVSNVFETLSKGGKIDTVTTENKSVLDTISDGISGAWDTFKSGVTTAFDSTKKFVGGTVDKVEGFLGFDNGESDGSIKAGGVSTDELETAKKIWKYFKAKGWSDKAIAGLLGNMYKESRLTSNRMQGDMSADLSKSKAYTEQADKNMSSFTNPGGIGYGLCQWTYGTRKEYLWKYTHSKHVSVGNTDAQIEFVDYEMNNLGGLPRKYKDELLHSTNIIRATEIILKQYEKPAKMNDPEELQERAKFAIDWLHRMTDKGDNGKSVVDTLDEKSFLETTKDTLKSGLHTTLEVGRAALSSTVDLGKNLATGNFGAIASDTAQGFKDAYGDLTKSGDVVCPTDQPVITSQFGKRPKPKGGGTTNHMGIDLRAGYGDPIYAAEDGTVVQAGGQYNWIWINQKDGLQARYLHNSRIFVKKGDKVKAGDKIALAGITDKTGRPHAGWTAHLHFALLKNGQFLDPEPWLRGKGVKLSLKDKGATARMPPMSDADVEVKDSKGNTIDTSLPPAYANASSSYYANESPSTSTEQSPSVGGIPGYANSSSSYYQTADQNAKSTDTTQGAVGNANSDVGIVSTAADSSLQGRSPLLSTVDTATTSESKPVTTEAPVITTDSVTSGNMGADTSSIGNQQLAELKIISGLLRDIRNGEKTVPDKKITDNETTLKSTPDTSSEANALSQLIPILQTIADRLSDTSAAAPAINTSTGTSATRTRNVSYPLDIRKR